ncbi:H/ACA ribonucleoprotein complex non-core subunit NAF1-like [Pseudoliparis swirei]|uniref:H/ACA ribonucleoprotein complex non-core subunit NAF1-like n=1 Tax=Pseudoliparis swirei TaxID=2059687 RepID=UPI0024BEA512|nr:H/ACA ribonucleoprotein complex non-core subunit NAF1-like [Pseudoliparis swirei]
MEDHPYALRGAGDFVGAPPPPPPPSQPPGGSHRNRLRSWWRLRWSSWPPYGHQTSSGADSDTQTSDAGSASSARSADSARDWPAGKLSG